MKEQGFSRKSHQKTYPLGPGFGIRDPGSGKNSSRIRIPDPEGKKAPDFGSTIPDPDPQHWCTILLLVTCLTGTGTTGTDIEFSVAFKKDSE
jgi:hypothetical protein